MNNKYIALIDSGVGGISLLLDFIKEMPQERFLYYGDNDNVPYGNKKDRELHFLINKIIRSLPLNNIKAIVVACNTLSVNYIHYIRRQTKLPTFGVYPPINKRGEREKTLLLATEMTCERYRGIKNIICCPLKNLATLTEKNLLHLNKDISICEVEKAFKFNHIKNEGQFFKIILGCTHYVFYKNEILNHFCPKKIQSGNKNTVKRVKKNLEKSKSLGNNKEYSVLFYGKNKIKNQLFFEMVVKEYLN